MKEHTLFMLKTLLFLSVVIGYVIYSVYKTIKASTKNSLFPPWPSECPDHWEVVGKDKCKNVKNIGNCSTSDQGSTVMDFSKEEIFKGDDSLYFKCQWSHNCNVTWEGVDNQCI